MQFISWENPYEEESLIAKHFSDILEICPGTFLLKFTLQNYNFLNF